MRSHRRGRRRRLTLSALCAVFLGGIAYAVLALTGVSHQPVAFAAATCNVTANGTTPQSYTATIALDGTTSTTLGQDSSQDLLVNGNPCGNFTAVNGAINGPLSAIVFSSPLASAPASPLSVVLDQTQPGGVFPCTVSIGGNINFYDLQVDGAAAEHVIIGAKGVDLNACGTAGVISGTIPSYLLVGGTGSGTEFDARGSVATGAGVTATFQAGDSTTETFDAGQAGSTLDFSQLTCPSGTCTIVSNSTGQTVGSPGVTKFHATLFSGSSPEFTFNYTVNEADFSQVLGNSSIPTTFFAPPSSTTTYVLGGNVNLQAGTGNYTVTSQQSNNQISAGSGTETFGVTGSNMVLSGGSGTDTFTVAGHDNVFQAGSGSDTFLDPTAPNTVDFSKVVTTTNPLRITTHSGTATAGAGGATTYTFLSAVAGSSTPFTTFLGATTGNTAFQTDSAGGLSFQGAGSGNSADFSTASNAVAVNLSAAPVSTAAGVPVNPGQVLVTSAPCPCAYDSLSNVSQVTGQSSGGNTFWGGSGTSTFDAGGSSNLFNGSSGGTYTIGISGSGSGNQVAAGAGTESFNVTGNGVTLNGGSGTATFTDTGNQNFFVAGSGPDFFYDSTGPNTVNFNNVGTSPNDQLAINAAGAPEQATLTGSPVTLQYGQAEVGSGTSYTFLNSPGSSSAAAFTAFDGATTGSTIFLGGAEFNDGQNGGVTYNGGIGGGNSLSFPAVSAGMTIDLSPFPLAGSANVTGNTPDSVTNITTITGSPQGGNMFTAGPAFSVGSSAGSYNFTGNGNGNTFAGGAGADVFTSNGSGNTFTAGSGTATFNDSGNGNTVDFSKLNAKVVVNVTNGTVGTGLGTDQASATFPSPGGTTKYFFSGFGAADATFIGSNGGAAAGSTFFAGPAADTFQGQGLAADTLTFADAPGNALQICVVAASGCSAGQAILGTVDEAFSGISVFDGLAAGNTAFQADDSTGRFTFNGAGSGNTADFSAAANKVQANLVTGQVTFTSGVSPDTISDVTTVFGSANGGNTMTAGTTSETFGDRGTAPLSHGGDAIDFSHVPTQPGSPLSINASGGGTATYTATFGSATYNFTTGGPTFTSFTGASGGFTTFLAGSTGGYSFKGQGGSNTGDFSADASPITANLSVTKSYGSGANTVGPSDVAVGTGLCTSLSAVCDTIADLATVIGSPNGANTFVAGGPGQKEIFQGGSNNTVDFSNLSTSTVVNVSQPGQALQGAAFGTATSGGTTYDFTNFASLPTRFVGSAAAGSTFFAGQAADTFVGQSLAADTLTFADAPGNPLQICVVAASGCSAGQAILGTVDEAFSGIKVFGGLAAGDTAFQADDNTGGFAFNGTGSGNTADFSAATNKVQANLVTGQVTFTSGVSPDTISDVSTVFGSANGGNTMTAGTTSETFGDRGTAPLSHGGDAIDFTHVPTQINAPLSINASGGGTATYTATFGSATYNFTTGGPTFTSFTGASGGFTTFLAGSTGGYSFKGQGGSNTGDFSADASPITANLSVTKSYGSGANTVGPSDVAVGTGLCTSLSAVCDTIADLATVIGSPNGANTFVAGGPGQKEIFQGGSNNTVDFSNLSTSTVVNVSQPGPALQGAAFGTATSGGTTYDFTNFASFRTTFVGDALGTTFFAGTTPDFFQGQNSATDTLSFADAPGSNLSICLVTSSTCFGQAQLDTTAETFAGIKVFNGLATSGSTTTFSADDQAGGYKFTGLAGTNTADFSSATDGITADLTKNTVTLGTGQPTDTISGIANVLGSTNGHNSFTASPTGSETFGDTGAAGGDSISFTHLLGATTNNPLTINATQATSANGTNPFTAALGTLTYSFAQGGSNFTGFTGSQSGNTAFIAPGSTSGLSFTGQAGGNTADFSANLTGITADMVGQTVTLSGVGGTDTIAGAIGTVVGSPVGKNTFDGGLTGTTFTAQNSSNGDGVSYVNFTPVLGIGVTFNSPAKLVQGPTGSPDHYSFPSSAPLTLQGSPGTDTFQIGAPALTIQGGGGTDVLDLSQVPAPSSGSTGVTVNLNGGKSAVTGSTIGGVGFTAATTCLPNATTLCLSTVTGSPQDDTYIANAASFSLASPVSITGNGGNDVLNLSKIMAAATVTMPMPPGTTVSSPACSSPPDATGAVCSGAGGIPSIEFTGIPNVVGSQPGGDTFFPGIGTENLSEFGPALGTLDYSVVPTPANTNNGTTGITVDAVDTGGSFTGTVTSPLAIGITDTISGFGTFVGTPDNDTFVQSGPAPSGPALPPDNQTTTTASFVQPANNNATVTVAVATTAWMSIGQQLFGGPSSNISGHYTVVTINSPTSVTLQYSGTTTGTIPAGTTLQTIPKVLGYVFKGAAGSNTLDLSAAPTSTVALTQPPVLECTGTPNNDGTGTFTGSNPEIVDQFSCIASLISSASEFQVAPGQAANVDGGGGGTLRLVSDTGMRGVTITLPVGKTAGTVVGDGYNFSFTGMSTVDGTPYNDVFIPGTGNVTLNGTPGTEGGIDWLNYASAPTAAVVNLSGSPYTIPARLPNAGTVVPAFTATGGNGGVITIGNPARTNTITNVTDSNSGDIVVAGPGTGHLLGGTGNDTFVPTAPPTGKSESDFVNGGGGVNTIDLSLLPGQTKLSLWSTAPQVLGTSAGTITLVPGTIQSAVASPAGSTLEGGSGNNVTLIGGPGPDKLAAGTGNQTLTGNGGNDVLVAGIGNDTLSGGSQPVTFIPGQGGTDTLLGSATGNTLSYGNVPFATPWMRPPLNRSGTFVNLSNQLASVPPGEPFAGAVLSAQSATGGWGASVDLTHANVNQLVGSAAPDVFVTGSGDTISGSGGNDLFVVSGANNTLTAATGSAARFLFEGAGNNIINGGGNATADFSQAPARVQVNLQTGSATGGFGGTQSLSGILNLTGTNFNDVLIAGKSGATVNGLSGSDLLEASPSGGDTLINGGSGNDTFCAQVGCNGASAAGGGNTMTGGTGNDNFFAKNNGVDTINGGSGFNTANVDTIDHVTNVQQITKS